MEKPRWVAFRWTYEPFEELRRPRHLDSSWQPVVNAYRCATCLQICFDLAGVSREEIDLTVEPRRIVLRGLRRAPEPCPADEARQILAMEIDHGPFGREILLPVEIDPDRTTAEHRDGLLWVKLPLRRAHE